MSQLRESESLPENISAEKMDIPSQKQYALVIGIDHYQQPLTSLSNATNDAKAVAKILSKDYGFTVTQLLDEQASKTVIESNIADALIAGADTRWLFYFAGHGAVINEQGVLLPADAEKGNVQSFLVLPDFLEDCKKSNCGEILLILDACYSGRGFVRIDTLDNPAPSAEERRVRQIITSGNPHEPVLDGGAGGHSIFTQTLLEILNGWIGVHEDKGQVIFSKMRDELAYQIPDRLRKMSYSIPSQQPLGGNFLGNISGRQITFTPRADVQRLPPEIVRDLRSGDSERRVSGWRSIPSKVNQATKAQADEMATWALKNDTSVSVRGASAAALGSLPGSKPAIQALIEALNDETAVCSTAAKSLGKLKAVDASSSLVEHLQQAPVNLFLDLVGAIGAIGDPTATLSALRIALQKKMLVPFIGPDLPQELTGVKSREKFAKDFAQYEGVSLSNSLAQVAEIATHGGNRNSLVTALKNAYDNSHYKPGSFYEALKSLKAPFWLSACYDNLLVKSLDANSIVMGGDTKPWRSDRPTVVRLVGDLDSIRGLIVLEKDYELLRENEVDRKFLLGFLQQELQGKIVLFLGFNPSNTDFDLLIKYVFNHHLAGTPIQTILVWHTLANAQHGSGQHAHLIQKDELELIKQLSISST